MSGVVLVTTQPHYPLPPPPPPPTCFPPSYLLTSHQVFEFVDTDLYKLIGSPQFLTDEHVKLFLYQMLIGLKYVHSAHVIHRDIKVLQ